MKVLDANVLIYAYNADSPHHAVCRAWLEDAINDADELVGLPWQTILAFMRITTHPRVLPQPLTIETAGAIVTSWLSQPNIQAVGYGEHFWMLYLEQAAAAKVSGALLTDAALAAVTLELGATLYSTDSDFRRFPTLKCVDPLTPE